MATSKTDDQVMEALRDAFTRGAQDAPAGQSLLRVLIQDMLQ